MDPEEAMSGAAAPSADSAAPMPADAGGGEDEGDSGPLSHIDIDPAEDGGSIATHHPRVPSRVKNMDEKSVRPRKHVLKNHEELVEHIRRHGKRLQP